MSKELPETSRLAEPEHLLPSETLSIKPGEVVLGNFIGLDSGGQPKVNFVFGGRLFENCLAQTTQALTSSHVGRQVVLMFVDQNLHKPIITGLIHESLDSFLTVSEDVAVEDEDIFPGEPENSLHVSVDGTQEEKLFIEGKEEVVLKCGEASITLTRQGKLILRGKYILSRSSGVNRILGGSVQVN